MFDSQATIEWLTKMGKVWQEELKQSSMLLSADLYARIKRLREENARLTARKYQGIWLW